MKDIVTFINENQKYKYFHTLKQTFTINSRDKFFKDIEYWKNNPNSFISKFNITEKSGELLQYQIRDAIKQYIIDKYKVDPDSEVQEVREVINDKIKVIYNIINN